MLCFKGEILLRGTPYAPASSCKARALCTNIRHGKVFTRSVGNLNSWNRAPLAPASESLSPHMEGTAQLVFDSCDKVCSSDPSSLMNHNFNFQSGGAETGWKESWSTTSFPLIPLFSSPSLSLWPESNESLQVCNPHWAWATGISLSIVCTTLFVCLFVSWTRFYVSFPFLRNNQFSKQLVLG